MKLKRALKKIIIKIVWSFEVLFEETSMSCIIDEYDIKFLSSF